MREKSAEPRQTTMQEKNQRASQATAKHQAPFWSLSSSVLVYAK